MLDDAAELPEGLDPFQSRSEIILRLRALDDVHGLTFQVRRHFLLRHVAGEKAFLLFLFVSLRSVLAHE